MSGEGANASRADGPLPNRNPPGVGLDCHRAEAAINSVDKDRCVQEYGGDTFLDAAQGFDPGFRRIPPPEYCLGHQRVDCTIAVPSDIVGAGTGPGLGEPRRRGILADAGKIHVEISGRAALLPDWKLELLEFELNPDAAKLLLH